jgi:hypothetical protein
MTKIEICEKPQVLTAQMNEDNDEPIAFFSSTNIQIDKFLKPQEHPLHQIEISMYSASKHSMPD